MQAEERVERAHQLYDAGLWDEAEQELRLAIAVNPYQSEWHFNLGLTLEASGRHQQASEAFRDAFETGGEPDGQIALLVAVNLIRAGLYEDAMSWLDKAEEHDPGGVEASAHRIEALGGLGRHDEAESVFYMAQQVDPECPDLFAAMSDSLMDRGKFEKAVWCLREAARLDPNLPRVQARLAEAYAATGRLERARQLYLRELRRDPGDVDTLLDLGTLLAEMHRGEEASEKYRRVLELEPDHAEAHALLGDLADERGDLAEALVHYDVALRMDPEAPGARRRLARVLLERGRDEDLPRARDLLRLELRAVRRDELTLTANERDEFGLLLLDAGIRAEAVRVLRQNVVERPDHHLSQHHLSVALLEQGETRRGMEHARRALSLQPRYVPSMHNLALAHMREGQWMRARYWVRQALQIEPEDPALRRLRLLLRARAALGVMLWGWRCVRVVGARLLSLVTRPRRAPALA